VYITIRENRTPSNTTICYIYYIKLLRATCFDPAKGSSSDKIIKQVVVHKMYACLRGSSSVHKV
jgi:hypothetical protein